MPSGQPGSGPAPGTPAEALQGAQTPAQEGSAGRGVAPAPPRAVPPAHRDLLGGSADPLSVRALNGGSSLAGRGVLGDRGGSVGQCGG